MIDVIVDKFNKGEVFLSLFGRSYALEFCVLVALRHANAPDNAISKPDLIDEATRIWDMRMHPYPFPGGNDPDRLVRSVVRDLRRRGALILSTSSGAGYWRAGNLEDVKDFTQNEFRDRALDMMITARTMRSTAMAIFGRQMSLIDLRDPANSKLYNQKDGYQ